MKKTLLALAALASLSTGLTGCATQAAAAKPQLNGEWAVVALNGTTVRANTYRIGFDPANQRFHAYFGCNRLMGSYQQQQQTVQFGQVASTMMACPKSKDENTGKNSLKAAQTWRIVSDGNVQRLQLIDEKQKVRLEAAPINK